MFFQNIHVFVKIFTFVTTPLKVSKDCDFFGFVRKIFDLWEKWCN